MTLADGESLTLGFARGGSFSYLAIEGGIAGEPMFGSLAVNARAGLGSTAQHGPSARAGRGVQLRRGHIVGFRRRRRLTRDGGGVRVIAMAAGNQHADGAERQNTDAGRV